MPPNMYRGYQKQGEEPFTYGSMYHAPPYDRAKLKDVLEKKYHVMKQSETWEESETIEGDLWKQS